MVERVDFKRARKHAWPPSQLSLTENLSVHVVLATERWSECRRASRLHSKAEASEGPGVQDHGARCSSAESQRSVLT